VKYFYSLLILLSASILLITSCKKDAPGLGIYTCNITSHDTTTAWSATKETIAIHAGAPVNLIGRDDSTTLIINLNGITDPGTYPVQDSSASYVSYTDGPGTFDVYKSLYGSDGTITVTEINDDRIVGHFDTVRLSNSFYTKTLTNGVFNIEFE
jgi:hypothetical protein